MSALAADAVKRLLQTKYQRDITTVNIFTDSFKSCICVKKKKNLSASFFPTRFKCQINVKCNLLSHVEPHNIQSKGGIHPKTEYGLLRKSKQQQQQQQKL